MKVALLMGGHSAEREVSLMSGNRILQSLHNLKHEVLVIDPQLQSNWINQLQQQPIDIAFNILHGGAGENGEVRAILNALGIVSTGSDVLGSSIAMSKPMTKKIWNSVGIPTPAWHIAKSPDDADFILNDLPLPLFVKPTSGGSSTKSSRVVNANDLPGAIQNAMSETGTALVETLINGTEYTLSIVNNQAQPLIKIVVQSEFYDYHAKYISDSTHFHCPSGLPQKLEAQLTEQGMVAFFVLECSEWGRVDFILGDDDKPYFLEVNTIPGMTSHSLVPMAAQANGKNFDQLVQQLMDTALCKK